MQSWNSDSSTIFLLGKKTRVLCTNAVSFLAEMDRIFVMKDGRISEQGTYSELLSEQGEFADFLVQYLTEEGEKELDPATESELEDLKSELEKALGKEKLERRISVARSAKVISLPQFCLIFYAVFFSVFKVISLQTTLSDLVSENSHHFLRKPKRQISTNFKSVSIVSEDSQSVRALEMQDQKATGQNLIEEEKMEIGGVKWDVYTYYARSIGLFYSIGTFALYLIYQGFSIGSNIWLSEWSTDPLANTEDSVRNKYLSVYGVLGFFQALFVMAAVSCVMVGTLKASSKLHFTMLTRILR